MLPTLSIGPISLPTYPLTLLLGYFLALWFASKVAARRGLDPDHLYNIGFYILIAGIVGGRLGHVILYFPAYRIDPLSVLSPNFTAMVPMASLVAALAVLIWYVRKHALPWPPLLDALAAAGLVMLAALALAEGLNGFGYGEPTTAPWAVYQWNVARHPVQYYESFGLLVTALWYWSLLPRLRPGFGALFALGGFAGVRLIVDAFRAEPLVVGDGYRLTQVIAWIVLLVVLLAFYQASKGGEKTPPSA
jgi:phosphatidylglycerol:prolipoprotein diacylglycerol transferase